MGVKKLIFYAVNGPLFIWGLLMLHVGYHHGFRTPGPMPKAYWPEHVKDDMKAAIIANRKFIIDDLKSMFNAKLDYKKFLQTRATEDIVFEDPLERFEGMESVGHFFSMVKYFDNFQFKIHDEVHSAHEALLDWELQFGFKFWPTFRINLPMRTHLLFEPPEKGGSAEKIFRIAEDWFGNEQLTEKTVRFFPPLGKVHQSLRNFMGTVVVWPVKNGYL